MKPTKRNKKRKMPSMHGPAIQCCLCIVGVFMFLGGLIMTSTGIVLILNYDFFDVNLLPPDLQSEDGKRTVGIILTVFGLLGIFVSVLVSALYLCSKSKPSRIDSDDISRIPSSARTNTPDRLNGVKSDRKHLDRDAKDRDPRERERRSSGHRLPAIVPSSNGKVIPGAVEVKHPRHYNKGKRHHRHHAKSKFPARSRLEEIKEADAISRKTVLGASRPDMSEYNDSLRSGSISSDIGRDEKTPRIVIGMANLEHGRPPSVDSASTSQTSELSKSMDADRKEFNDGQAIEMSQMGSSGKENMEGPYKEMYGGSAYDSTDSLKGVSDYRRSNSDAFSSVSTDLVSNDSTSQQFEETRMTQPIVALASDSDNSVISYRTKHQTEVNGMNTFGRISPQIDSPERTTVVEVDKYSLDDSLLNDSKTTLLSNSTVMEAPGLQAYADLNAARGRDDDDDDIVQEQVAWRHDDSVIEDNHLGFNDKDGLV